MFELIWDVASNHIVIISVSLNVFFWSEITSIISLTKPMPRRSNRVRKISKQSALYGVKMKLKKFSLIICLILLSTLSGSAQISFTELSGELPSVLSAEKPYLVVGDIYVSHGSIVTIEAGAILLFTEFSGLHVQGTLYVKGTEDKMVYFTSQYDTSINVSSPIPPAPFDWNGIDVYDGAIGSEFRHCHIRYSVYGIRSQTEHIKIVSSIFSRNGKSYFSIKDVRKEIVPDSLYSYEHNQSAVSAGFTADSDTVPTNLSLQIEPETPGSHKINQHSKGAKFFRYAGLLIGAGCGAYTAVSYVKDYKPAAGEFDDLSNPDELQLRKYSSQDWIEVRNRRDKSLVKTLAGAAGTVLGLLSFSISFAF